MVEFGNSEIREFGNLVILRGCATSFSFYLFAHGNSKIWEFGSVRFVSGLTNKIGSQEKFFFSHGNLEIRKFGDFAGAPLLFFFLFICSREFENSEIRKFAFRFRPHEQKLLTRKVFFSDGNSEIGNFRFLSLVFPMFQDPARVGRQLHC